MERKDRKNAQRKVTKSTKKIDNSGETRIVRGSDRMPDRDFVGTQRHVRRFNQLSAVTNQAFMLANGHDQFLAVTSALGAAVPYADSWRIRRLSFWLGTDANWISTALVVPTAATTDNMICEPEAAYQLTCRSPAEPVSMHIYPSKRTPFGAWHFTSNVSFAATLFQVNVNGGGNPTNNQLSMEVEFDVKLNLVGLPLGYGVTTATTTVGTIGGRNILSGMQIVAVNNLG
jgi:hypothetical protein